MKIVPFVVILLSAKFASPDLLSDILSIVNTLTAFTDNVIGTYVNATQAAYKDFQYYAPATRAYFDAVALSAYTQLNRTHRCPTSLHTRIKEVIANYRTGIDTCNNNALSKLNLNSAVLTAPDFNSLISAITTEISNCYAYQIGSSQSVACYSNITQGIVDSLVSRGSSRAIMTEYNDCLLALVTLDSIFNVTPRYCVAI